MSNLKFKFNRLGILFKDMLQNKVTREKFKIQYNQIVLDVLFIVEEIPYTMTFFKRGYNKIITFNIERGFVIDLDSKEKYKELVDFLEIKYDENNKFSPFSFFKIVDKDLPEKSIRKKLLPQDLIDFYSNIDEEDKIYYCGLKIWNNNGKKGVREKNLEKTKKLIGYDAFEICKKYNISTCWCNHKNKSKEFIFNGIEEVSK